MDDHVDVGAALRAIRNRSLGLLNYYPLDFRSLFLTALRCTPKERAELLAAWEERSASLADIESFRLDSGYLKNPYGVARRDYKKKRGRGRPQKIRAGLLSGEFLSKKRRGAPKKYDDNLCEKVLSYAEKFISSPNGPKTQVEALRKIAEIIHRDNNPNASISGKQTAIKRLTATLRYAATRAKRCRANKSVKKAESSN